MVAPEFLRRERVALARPSEARDCRASRGPGLEAMVSRLVLVPRHWGDCPQHPLLVGEVARARGSTNRHGTTTTATPRLRTARCRFPDWP